MSKSQARSRTPRARNKRVRRSARTRPKVPAARGAASPVETLKEQADRLGLLDPLDVEPAHRFSPEESET